MTDPSTLYLSSSQLRPSWTINGLTLELNLAPTPGSGPAVTENSNYAAQSFQGIHPNNTTTGAVFASVVGQGQCSAPFRLAVRGGSSSWTHTAPTEHVSSNLPAVVGDSIFAITQSAAFLSSGLNTNSDSNTLNASVPATGTTGSVPVSSVAGTTTFVPSNAVFEQSLCQLQQLVAKGLLSNPALANDTTPPTSNAINPLNTSASNSYLASSGTSDAKRRSESADQTSQRSSPLCLDRKKRPKLWKSSLAVAPQGISEKTNLKSGDTESATIDSVCDLSPSSICSTAVNTPVSEGTSTSVNSLKLPASKYSLVSPNDQKLYSDRILPSFSLKDIEGSACQVAEITTSTLSNRSDNSPVAYSMRTSAHNSLSSQADKVTAAVTSPLSSHLPASTPSGVSSSHMTSLVSSAVTVPSATVTNNGNIPVGIAVARQRYVSSSNHKTQTHVKESLSTSSSAASYSSAVPYHQAVIDASVFSSSIPNIGLVAGTSSCDDRNGSNIGGGILPPIIAWPTHTPSIPTQQQHNPQQWHSCTGPVETSMQNIPSACGGYQLARDPMSGQIVLIPASPIDSVRQRTAFLITGGTQLPATGYSSTNQQIQSFLIPQQQSSQSHSLFLDHLVTVVPSNIHVKQKPASSALPRLDDGSKTGVMMSCDLAKSSSVNPAGGSAAIGQQLISTNNSSFSLVQQFNASNIHNSTMNVPHHFSSISSSGSLLIQQISGNTGPPPLMNHVNNSLMIAETAAAAQSVISSQPPYPTTNASYLINAQNLSSENSTLMDQIQPSPCIISANSQQNENYSNLSSRNLPCSKSSSMTLSSNTFRQSDLETKTNKGVCSTQSNCQSLSTNKSTEEAVITTETNSCVQDASNQTESYQDVDEDEDDDDDDDDDDVYDDDDDDDADIDDDDDDDYYDENEEDDERHYRGNNNTYKALQLKKDKDSKAKCKTTGGDKKVYSDENPDFRGLQLLLNGIERVEHCSNKDSFVEAKRIDVKGEKLRIKQELEESDKETDNPTPNGLEILCALADQRFQEENDGESDDSSLNSFVRKKVLCKSSKSGTYKYEVDHQLKNFKSKHESRRILSSKYGRHQVRSLSPCGNKQLQMRIELAKLRKRYCDAQKELKRLNYRKYARSFSATRSSSPSLETQAVSNIESHSEKSCIPVKRRPGRPRKNSENLDSTKLKNDVVFPLSTVKPVKRPKLKLDTESFLQGSEDEEKVSKSNNGDLSPPVLEPMCTSPKPKSFISDILSPPTLIPSKKSYFGPKMLNEIEHKRPSEFENKPLFRLSSDDSSNEETHKPKPKLDLADCPDRKTEPPVPKRKVGRPRKYPKNDATSSSEIVVKKLKHDIRNLTGNTTNKNKEKRNYSLNKSTEKQVPVTSSVVSTFAMLKSQAQRKSMSVIQDVDVESKPKITPKLKAEAKLKTRRQESPESGNDILDVEYRPKKRKVDAIDDFLRIKERKDAFNKRSKYHAKSRDFTFNYSLSNAIRIPSSTSSEYSNEDFRITPELLDASEKCPLRVLIAVGGLFRAGELSAVRPPDLYGIKLDGERGQRTHIYTKEEILKDVVLEVRGKYPLRNGTRVCAFWSAQYLSLYPGFVTSFSSSEESEDENFTAVEFDDGDSGRINMKDIRLLPTDFSINRRTDNFNPCNEYTVKRKRRTSSISYEEIPVDKQLHSPESPSLCRQISMKNDQIEYSPHTTSTAYESPLCSPPNAGLSSDQKQELKNESEMTVPRNDITIKEKSGERKRLKKKRKDKVRDGDDSSCKRKNRKHRSDTDEGSAKGHKRRKHKHKHHKHHKRKRSPSSRKYIVDHSKPLESNNSVIKLITKDDDSKWIHVSHSENVNISTKSDIHVDDGKNFDSKSSYENVPCKKDHVLGKLDLASEKVKCLSPDLHEFESTEKIKLEQENFNNIIDSHSLNEEIEELDSLTIPEVEVDEEPLLIKEVSDSLKAENQISVSLQNVVVESNIDRKEEPEERTTVEPLSSISSEVVESKISKKVEQKEDLTDSDTNLCDKFWEWFGKGFKRNGKGRAKKEFYKSIKRGDVIINVGDCAVFLTAGSSAKPFIGRIESMWESYGNMMVRVNWFYHPEETTGLTQDLPFLGALFESPHNDKNEVQTISHKCNVVTVQEYRERLLKEPEREHNVYQSNDLYYLAGYYDPTAKRLTFENGVLS